MIDELGPAGIVDENVELAMAIEFTTTVSPSAAGRSTVRSPIPLDEPVTKAT